METLLVTIQFTCVNTPSKIGNKTRFKVWRKRLLRLANVYLMHTGQNKIMKNHNSQKGSFGFNPDFYLRS